MRSNFFKIIICVLTFFMMCEKVLSYEDQNFFYQTSDGHSLNQNQSYMIPVNKSIEPIHPTLIMTKGNGSFDPTEKITYRVEGSLPLGLELNRRTGEISGIPLYTTNGINSYNILAEIKSSDAPIKTYMTTLNLGVGTAHHSESPTWVVIYASPMMYYRENSPYYYHRHHHRERD